MKRFISFLILLNIAVHTQAQTRQLDDYIHSAVAASPLIHDLNNQISAAKLDSMRIKAGFKTQLSANGLGLFAPIINGYGYSQAITNGQQLMGVMTADKQFIGTRYLHAQLSGIANRSDSLQNGIRLSEQDLRKNITAQYLTAFGDQEQFRFLQNLLQLLNTEKSILLKLTRDNVYKQADYLAFLVTLKQAELQLEQARMQYRTDASTLNYLSGIRDTTIDTLTRPQLPATFVTGQNNSIYFRQFQLDSIRNRNANALIDYAYQPKFHVFADAGYNSDLSAGYYKNFGASAGFGLTIPIYDGGQRKLAHQKIALEEDTRQQYLAFFEKQYVQQIRQLKDQIADYDRLLTDVRKQYEYTGTLIKVDAGLLQTGDLKIADFILAINNYLSVKSLMNTNTINQLQLINQLNYWSK